MSYKQYLKRSAKYILRGVPVKNITASISYLQPNSRLAGKKIIVTGGGKGLGAAMAKKFVDEGASVLISGRNEQTLQSTADKIGCKYLTLDIQNTAELDNFISEADRILEGVDSLVNNAGISLHEPTFFDVTPETFDAQIATNLRGGFFLTQSFTKLLLHEKRKGNVLFISSETGETVDIRPYGFTKAAINSMVQGLACLFVKDNIRVNAVAPGITASDMTGIKSDGNLFLSINATERVYLPEEVAETTCFLLSDASGCISGQIILCNNGRTINPRWK
ncbi:SDR family oxidoreductase [uncultured Prevotella sp.]|uniref:SDR family NAD(P)-dependent oxidoreductase n=1 Tax=uncultured Prevotella sp. TaxID=159272 RepID=UPI0025DA2F9A|nr:SDR family oxidoreductase [uncultured Prevotella sp.]